MTMSATRHVPGLCVVGTFDALMSMPFRDGVNAICWQRTLRGDFDEVARRLASDDDMTTIDEAQLASLDVNGAGRRAIEVILEDLRLLREAGHEPTLDCVRKYRRDPDPLLPTDVYSFHVDSATTPTDTFLCTYAGPPSEGLRNAEARRLVDVPARRARLLERFGGGEGGAFEAWLEEHCYDLHYEPAPGAAPFSFGVSNLWRIAVQYPGSPVPPCIHRAPEVPPGTLRLLLIS